MPSLMQQRLFIILIAIQVFGSSSSSSPSSNPVWSSRLSGLFSRIPSKLSVGSRPPLDHFISFTRNLKIEPCQANHEQEHAQEREPVQKRHRFTMEIALPRFLNILSIAEAATESSGSTKQHHSRDRRSAPEQDIIHDHDHADNDAYDDIVWYDGPHRDDEDEHDGYVHHDGYDDHDDHDDHDDGHHHDEDGDEDEDEEHAPEHGRPQTEERVIAHHPSVSRLEVLANLHRLSNIRESSSQSRQLVFQDSHAYSSADYGHDHDHGGEGLQSGSFHHSGKDIIQGYMPPAEFCLRLKHECESTCRSLIAEVRYLSTDCQAGSVAELLLWGWCCQVGQVHRVQKTTKTKFKSKIISKQAKDSNPNNEAKELGRPTSGGLNGATNDLNEQSKKSETAPPGIKPESSGASSEVDRGHDGGSRSLGSDNRAAELVGPGSGTRVESGTGSGTGSGPEMDTGTSQGSDQPNRIVETNEKSWLVSQQVALIEQHLRQQRKRHEARLQNGESSSV